MSAIALIEMIVLGAAFGAFGGLFGVGGGIIAIPALVMAFGMNQQLAQGTTLAMTLPSAVFGFWKYRKRNALDLRVAAMLCSCAVLATYFAAQVANKMSDENLRRAFAIFLVVTAAYLGWKTLRARASASGAALAWHQAWLVGVLGGLLSGLFGVGGATIAPPVLTTFFAQTQTAAQGLALAMIIPGIAVALAVYARAGAVDWAIGIPLAIGAVAAVPLGVAAAHALPGEKLKLLFCGFMMLSAVAIVLRHQ